MNNLSYGERMKLRTNEILFIENMYGITEIDFETALTPLHYLDAMAEFAEQQVKTCNKPAVIKSCENCKFDAECRHKQVMPLGYHYCKFYIEHVL